MRVIGGMATRYGLRSRRTSEFTELELIADISMGRRRTRAALDRRDPRAASSRMFLRTTRLALALIVVAVACSDATAPACTAQVTLTATARPVPTFTWTPECGVGSLITAAPPSLGFVNYYWYIRSDDARIEPRVRYGRVPSGAVEVEPARPLPSGARIGVQVTNASGQTIGATVLVVP
jgi:hypothetical protein